MKTRYQQYRTTAGLSLCIAILGATLPMAAAAEVFFHHETPEYDAINDTQGIGLPLSTTGDVHYALGQIDGGLDTDIWAYLGKRHIRAVRVSSSADVDVDWVLDENHNLFPDDGELRFEIPQEPKEYSSVLHVRNGRTLLAVVRNSGGTTDYSVYAEGMSIAERRITATIVSARALDNFDGAISGDADFRARIEFEPSSSDRFACAPVSCTVKKVVSNDNTPTFDLQASKRTSVSNRKIPIVLSLVDQDPGKDDAADISPGVPSRNLELEYDAFTKKVYGPSGELLGLVGEMITVEGTDSNRRARLVFRIDSQEPVGPQRGS